jgi:hypothetical protein
MIKKKDNGSMKLDLKVCIYKRLESTWVSLIDMWPE